MKTRPRSFGADGKLLPKAAALTRNQELLDACRALDGAPGDRGGKAALEDRILAKLEIYSDWCGRHGVTVEEWPVGRAKTSAVLAAVGHAGHPVSKRLSIAANRIALQRGLRRSALRHTPIRPIDDALDIYEAIVLERGKGPPRIARTPIRLSASGAAAEIGCEREDLDALCMRRLKLLAGAVAEPGDLFVDPGDDARSRSRSRPNNPAVATLVAAALRKAGGRLPASPMRPKELDLPTFADLAGVSVTDIAESGQARQLIDIALREATLVASPFVAARRLSYHDLQEHGRAKRAAAAAHHEDPLAAGRTAVRALTLFRASFGTAAEIGDEVPNDFPKLVEEAIASRPDALPSGWAARMRDWVTWFHSARSEKPLPDLFAGALSLLCAENGITEQQFMDASTEPSTVHCWLRGETVPTMGKQAILERVERLFHLSSRRLTDLLSAEWRARRFDLDELELDIDVRVRRHLPEDFLTWDEERQRKLVAHLNEKVIRQDTQQSRRSGEMTRDRYRLPRERWTEAMVTGWERQQPKPSDEDYMPLPGDTRVPTADKDPKDGRKDEWRQGTIDHREGLLSALFGYLIRPRKLAPEEPYVSQSRKTDFRPEAGLGIPEHLITPAIFAFPDLVATYSWWRMRRSGGRVSSIGDTLFLASEFTRPETGVLWRSPEMIADIRAFKKWWDANPHDMSDGPRNLDIRAFEKNGNWETACAAVHERVRADFKRFRKGKLPVLRDPFVAIDNFLKKGLKPMVEYMKGVRVLLGSRPHSVISKHVHTRNCALALILVQTGLRASTLLLNVSGKDQTIFKETDEETGEDVWRIRIPAAKFKNFDGPYFSEGQPYDFDLANEDDLYDILDRYVTMSRPYLLRGRASDALFITYRQRDMTTVALNQVYRRITRYYFVNNGLPNNGGLKNAMIHGPHAVRHVIASHIVRVTGDLYLAAWAIQDSVKTVERYYARFVPTDKAALAAQVLIKARAVGRGADLRKQPVAAPLPLAA